MYSWFTEGASEVRLINLDGSNKRTILRVEHTSGFAPKDKFPNVFLFSKKDNRILCSKQIEEGDKNIQKIYWFDMDSKDEHMIYDFGVHFVNNFSLSPDEQYLLFHKYSEESNSTDIFTLHLPSKKITNLSLGSSNEFKPLWNSKGDQIFFISDKTGTNNIYKTEFEKQSIGDFELVKKNLGKNILSFCMTSGGSIYYSVNNERVDIYTMDLKAMVEKDELIYERITPNVFKFGGHAPNYSQDGRYISYISWGSNFKDTKAENVDYNLGSRYFLNIYDTKLKTHREIDSEVYTNHHYSDINEYIPSWSFDNKKLILHGKIRDEYKGGFVMVDVHSGEVTPLKVAKNSVSETPIRAGRFPRFSKKENKFYYMSSDWKELREFNIDKMQDKKLLYNERGFFFREIDSQDENFFLYNSKGHYYYNRVSDTLITLEKEPEAFVLGYGPDKKDWYGFAEGEHTWIKKMVKINGENGEQKVLDFAKLFPDGRIWLVNFHPKKDVMVFEMKTNLGKEFFKVEWEKIN
jgi:Tol biopolymer transport system component